MKYGNGQRYTTRVNTFPSLLQAFHHIHNTLLNPLHVSLVSFAPLPNDFEDGLILVYESSDFPARRDDSYGLAPNYLRCHSLDRYVASDKRSFVCFNGSAICMLVPTYDCRQSPALFGRGN